MKIKLKIPDTDQACLYFVVDLEASSKYQWKIKQKKQRERDLECQDDASKCDLLSDELTAL